MTETAESDVITQIRERVRTVVADELTPTVPQETRDLARRALTGDARAWEELPRRGAARVVDALDDLVATVQVQLFPRPGPNPLADFTTEARRVLADAMVEDDGLRDLKTRASAITSAERMDEDALNTLLARFARDPDELALLQPPSTTKEELDQTTIGTTTTALTAFTVTTALCTTTTTTTTSTTTTTTSHFCPHVIKEA